MKIPLLFHANPRIGVGPTVMLTKGNWRIESNCVDSEVRASLNSLAFFIPYHNQEIILEVDTPIQVSVNKPGTESSLTIFAHYKE